MVIFLKYFLKILFNKIGIVFPKSARKSNDKMMFNNFFKAQLGQKVPNSHHQIHRAEAKWPFLVFLPGHFYSYFRIYENTQSTEILLRYSLLLPLPGLVNLLATVDKFQNSFLESSLLQE